MPRLVIFDDSMRGVDLPDHAVIIGRSQKVDIPIRDGILSRKHCSIVPPSSASNGPSGATAASGDRQQRAGETGAGEMGASENGGAVDRPSGSFRLLDLKSQNGTFVNGERVEKSDLEFDDIIEIGNTVLVFLDTQTWERGEGLTRLRNPVKAQELVQRINRREPLEAAAASSERGRTLGHPASTTAAGSEVEALTQLVLHEYAKSLLQSRPGLRARIARGVRSLGNEVVSLEQLRAKARRFVQECLDAEAENATDEDRSR